MIPAVQVDLVPAEVEGVVREQRLQLLQQRGQRGVHGGLQRVQRAAPRRRRRPAVRQQLRVRHAP